MFLHLTSATDFSHLSITSTIFALLSSYTSCSEVNIKGRQLPKKNPQLPTSDHESSTGSRTYNQSSVRQCTSQHLSLNGSGWDTLAEGQPPQPQSQQQQPLPPQPAQEPPQQPPEMQMRRMTWPHVPVAVVLVPP